MNLIEGPKKASNGMSRLRKCGISIIIAAKKIIPAISEQ